MYGVKCTLYTILDTVHSTVYCTLHCTFPLQVYGTSNKSVLDFGSTRNLVKGKAVSHRGDDQKSCTGQAASSPTLYNYKDVTGET